MKKFEIHINPDDLTRGGMIIWKKETKKKIFDAKWKIFIFLTAAFISFFFLPQMTYFILAALLALVILDYLVTRRSYKQMAEAHINNSKDSYFVALKKEGWSLSESEKSKPIFSNTWKNYDYFVENQQEGFIAIVDKEGAATNLFFKSWMREEAFAALTSAIHAGVKQSLS